jgi:Tfp pilus assembly PilM family ATPase
MWNDKITLFIDDTSIRVMVIRGQKIKRWADLKLDPGLIKDNIVLDETEGGSRLKKFLVSEKIKAKKVILGYSGLRSMTRPATIPLLPKNMLAEAVAREARRVFSVPLDQLYLSWRTIPCPKGRVQVFMGATPRKTADSLIATLHNAGLEPFRMALKPLSLTQALAERKAIIVDIQPSEYDIVIVSDGIPQPVRSIAFPEEELTWEKKMETIASDVNLTTKFFDTTNPEKPLDPKAPILVSGELTDKPDMQKLLADATGHPVAVLNPPFQITEQLDLGRYMFNITMAMKPAIYDNETLCPAGSLNLLPAPYQPKPISMVKAAGIPAGAAVVAIAVPMIMMMQGTTANINLLQKQLDNTNQIIVQKTAQKTDLTQSITELGNQTATSKATIDHFNLALTTIQTQQEYLSGDLSTVLSMLPSNITLTSFSESGDTVTISGAAPTEQDIYQYAQSVLDYGRKLDSSNRFKETIVSSLGASLAQPTEGQEQPTGSITFTLIFKR